MTTTYSRPQIRRKQRDLDLPDLTQDLVLVCSSKDGISMENNEEINIRTVEIEETGELPENEFANCSAIYLLSANLNGMVRSRLTQLAASRAMLLKADSYREFVVLLKSSIARSLRKMPDLTVTFSPPPKPKLKTESHHFSPVMTGLPTSETLPACLNRMVKTADDRKLPALLLIDKYYSRIPPEVRGGCTKIQLAALWRRHYRVQCRAKEFVSVYEVVEYWMKQEGFEHGDARAVADRLFARMRQLLPNWKSQKHFSRILSRLVQAVYFNNPGLRDGQPKT